MKEPNYIKEEVFTKMTKKEKLGIDQHSNYDEIEIDKLVLVPMNTKNGGYFEGSFFAHTPNKGWWRPMTYDCWQISTEIDNPITPRYKILKGDFENGGVNIFGFADEHCRAFISYGGSIVIKKKSP